MTQSRAGTLRDMVGDLRTDLACLAAPSGAETVADRAKSRLADIQALGAAEPIERASRHVAEAIDRVLDVKQQAEAAGAPLDAEQVSRSVSLLEDPMSELGVAVQALP